MESDTFMVICTSDHKVWRINFLSNILKFFCNCLNTRDINP